MKIWDQIWDRHAYIHTQPLSLDAIVYARFVRMASSLSLMFILSHIRDTNDVHNLNMTGILSRCYQVLCEWRLDTTAAGKGYK